MIDVFGIIGRLIAFAAAAVKSIISHDHYQSELKLSPGSRSHPSHVANLTQELSQWQAQHAGSARGGTDEAASKQSAGQATAITPSQGGSKGEDFSILGTPTESELKIGRDVEAQRGILTEIGRIRETSGVKDVKQRLQDLSRQYEQHARSVADARGRRM